MTGNGRHRILMTLDAVGGVWQYAMGLARELKRGGHSIVFAGLGPTPSPAQHAEASAIGTVTWLSTPPDWLARSAKELEGLPAELSKLVEEHAIDLVHLNAPSQAVGLNVPCPVAAVSHSCVVTWFQAVRGEPPSDGDWAWHKDVNADGLKRADIAIAPSASHAEALKRSYGEIPHLHVVHNAVEAAPVETRRERMVSAAGRWWDEGKNGRILDAAAGRIDIPIFAAGPTRGENGSGIFFTHVMGVGPLSNAETRELMAQSSIFVSPSIYEPFGLAALEAAHAATPLILADIPTYREVWGDAAVFVDPHYAEDLAEAIQQLMGNPQKREALGQAAREQASRYTLARQAAEMQALYAGAVARYRNGS